MAETSCCRDNVVVLNRGTSEHGQEFVYHRSRGRTREEDSWLRNYRRTMREQSPESTERRSYGKKCPKKRRVRAKRNRRGQKG